MDYTGTIRFEWDEAKSEACFRERGFDFAYVTAALADPRRLIRRDTRYSYGEDRYRLTGRIEGRLFVLVYTPRNGAIRIVSARKANAREMKQYEDRSNED